MAYWMRVFCRKTTAPTPGRILEALSSAELPSEFDPEADVNPGDPSWGQIAIVLGRGAAPLIVDRDVPGRGKMLDEEVVEFLDRLKEVPRTRARDRIATHLRATKQIVSLQIPTSSIDSRGWAVAHAVMRFLVRECDGLVHADGEGFYTGNDLVLALA